MTFSFNKAVTPYLGLLAGDGAKLSEGCGEESGEEERPSQEVEGMGREFCPQGSFQEPHGDIEECRGKMDTQLDNVLRTG